MIGRRSIRYRSAPFVVLAAALTTAAMAAPPSSMVTGKYLGNGKAAQLPFALAVPHEKWENETAYTLILSGKDATKSRHPDIDAAIGELGDALVIHVTQKGSIIGTEVGHQALKKSGFSSVGSLKVDHFSTEGGKLSGHFFTDGESDFMGDKWQVDLEVKGVPLPK